MAQVRGYVKLRGSMGETTFKKGRGKVGIAHDKLDLSKDRMKYHSTYESLRNNASEFSNASTTAKLLRRSIANLLNTSKDSKMTNRLVNEMMMVLKKDTVTRTFRQEVRAENMTHLLGFNFNENVRLRVAFNVPYRTTINRQTGEVTIKISGFKPSSAIRGPKFATHFKIVTSAIEIDLIKKFEYHNIFSESEMIALNSSSADPLIITHQLTPQSTAMLMIVVGLQFSEETGYYYQTREQQQMVNPLSLVDLNLP